MKVKVTLLVLTVIVIVSSCKKEKSPTEVATSFNAATYEKVCTWDANGKPDCLLSRDVISGELLSFVNSTLPEGKDLRQTNPSLLSSSAIADIAVTESSDVFITFVTQSTSLNNSFAYYTFPTGQAPKTQDDIKKITYVFPNVKSNSPLVPGDKVKIGHFEAGTSIGFVLVQGGWNASAQKPDDKAVHFCSNDILNPEVDPALKKHAVLVKYAPENKILIGFDDAMRTSPSCDHDFNDVVFYATVTK